MAEAASFFSGRLRGRTGESSPEDVASGVHVDHTSAGFLRFALQDRHELSPARIVDTSVQSALGGHVGAGDLHHPLGRATHVFDLEILDTDQVVLGDQLPGHVVVEVPTLVGHQAVPGGNGVAGGYPIPRTTVLGGEDLLGPGQTFGACSSVPDPLEVALPVRAPLADSPATRPHALLPPGCH